MEEKLKAMIATYQQMLANEQLQRISVEADLTLAQAEIIRLSEPKDADVA